MINYEHIILWKKVIPQWFGRNAENTARAIRYNPECLQSNFCSSKPLNSRMRYHEAEFNGQEVNSVVFQFHRALTKTY